MGRETITTRTGVDDRDRSSCARQLKRGRHAGIAPANYDDVTIHVASSLSDALLPDAKSRQQGRQA